MKVITYGHAYHQTQGTIDLCPACATQAQPQFGALGPVQHGLHAGECEGHGHGSVDDVRRVRHAEGE